MIDGSVKEVLLAFRVGEKVVYPNHGVSVVEQIREAEIAGIRNTYLHLRLISNNSKVMVPIENSELIGLRRLTARKEASSLLRTLANGKVSTLADWKGRYKQNLDKMKSGRLSEIAEVLKALNQVMQKKALSFREKKMYERAKYLIVSEIAVVDGSSEEEITKKVDRALARSTQKGSSLAQRLMAN
jgi:CarD family transcriptional regulator